MAQITDVVLSVASRSQGSVELRVEFKLIQASTEQATDVVWQGTVGFFSVDFDRAFGRTLIRQVDDVVRVGPSSEAELPGSFTVKFRREELDEDQWWFSWFDNVDEIEAALLFTPRVPSLFAVGWVHSNTLSEEF